MRKGKKEQEKRGKELDGERNGERKGGSGEWKRVKEEAGEGEEREYEEI